MGKHLHMQLAPFHICRRVDFEVCSMTVILVEFPASMGKRLGHPPSYKEISPLGPDKFLSHLALLEVPAQVDQNKQSSKYGATKQYSPLQWPAGKSLGLVMYELQSPKWCLALRLAYMDPTAHFPTPIRMQNYAGACAVDIA